MRLGVMSDIHGNVVALEAVLADAAARGGVDHWWVLGDLVAIGPEPVRTLEILGDLPAATVTRGNTERYVLTRDRPPPTPDDALENPELLATVLVVEGSFSWTRGALAATGWLEYLTELPLEVRTTLPDGTRVLGVHASPGCDDGRGITPHRDHDELAAALAIGDADIVIGGHTHQPTDRVLDTGVRALNGGSVSNPIVDDRRASYLVIHADERGHTVEHRRASYDHDEFLRRVEGSSYPDTDFIASFQRGDQVRFPAVRAGAPVPVSDV